MRVKMNLSVDSGNAAFSEDPQSELVRILRQCADVIDLGGLQYSVEADLPVRDVNGNKVGDFWFEIDPEELN